MSMGETDAMSFIDRSDVNVKLRITAVTGLSLIYKRNLQKVPARFFLI